MINRVNISTSYIQYEKKEPKIETKETKKLSRVEEIKKAIEQGEYKIDIKKTAKAMAESLK